MGSNPTLSASKILCSGPGSAQYAAMRAAIVALIVSVSVFAAPQAFAAPTCQNKTGDTVRCATPGAMPVGWSVPPEVFAQRHIAESGGEELHNALNALYLVALLLGVIALMPDFDGWRDGDWDDDENNPDTRKHPPR